jgi:hypothetical protein
MAKRKAISKILRSEEWESLERPLLTLCGLDPKDFDEDYFDSEGAMADELRRRLKTLITMQSRMLAAVRVDKDDPERFDLFIDLLSRLVKAWNEQDKRKSAASA